MPADVAWPCAENSRLQVARALRDIARDGAWDRDELRPLPAGGAGCTMEAAESPSALGTRSALIGGSLCHVENDMQAPGCPGPRDPAPIDGDPLLLIMPAAAA